MSERDHPRVSIGMPVWNCAPTIATAIHSILNQTYSEWELLILDDGSTDATATIAGSFADSRIRVIADGFHSGLPARLQAAVRLSRGQYFARMDGDDVAFPQRLARQVAYLDSHPEIDLVAASVVVFRGNGEVVGQREIRESHAWLCRRPWGSFPLPHPTWMGKIEWFRSHPYRSAAVRTEDQELLLRSYERSRFAGIPEVLLGYREDRLSLFNLCRGRMNYLKAVVRHFCRRRQYLPALTALLGHSARMLVDVLAVISGLNHQLLRHRARPAPASLVRQWESVWHLNAVPAPQELGDIGGGQHVWNCR